MKQSRSKREPRALEARVPREKDVPARTEVAHFSHTFHGALPSTQSASRNVLSRRVSMGCQKPWCW